jgi:hypothetical protein
MKRSAIYISTVLLLAFAACTERIDVEVDTSFTRLVVEGAVTTDTLSHIIRLSTTSDYFNNQTAPAVSGAVVEISDGESFYLFEESDTEPGYYYSDPGFHGIPGKTYRLEIRNADIDSDGAMEVYTASSKLNPANPVDSIKLEYFNTFITGYNVNIYAWDPPRVDFYAFKVLKNGKLLTDTLSELIVQNDEFFNGKYTNGITSQFLFDEKPDEKVSLGDTITFELNGITEEYFLYVIEAQSQIFPQTPLFSGPPANIRSNISGDAIGFFTAYSVQRSSTIATGDVIGGGRK